MTPEEKLLVSRHHDRLLRYFRRRVSGVDGAEDLVNEVFTRAWEGLACGIRPTESLDRWLWGIARNVWREHGHAGARMVGSDPSFLDDRFEDPDGLDDAGKVQAVKDAWEIIGRLGGQRRLVLTTHLQAAAGRGFEPGPADLADELGRSWSPAKVDQVLGRAKADVHQRICGLAVARAADGCPTAARLVGRAGRRPRVADVPDKILMALAEHAASPVCRHCHRAYRDARRPGLYALGPGLMLLAARAAQAPEDEERSRALALMLWRPQAGILRRIRELITTSLIRSTDPAVTRMAAVVVSAGAALLLSSAPEKRPDLPPNEHPGVVAGTGGERHAGRDLRP